MSSSPRFFSCLQTGLNGTLDNIADENGLPESDEASVIPSLRIAGIAHDFSQTMYLRGPGDVLRIDPNAVRTVEPKPMARDVAPNFFPYIELNDATLPWMFTPARPGASGRLIPWLVLVVVAKNDDISLKQLARQPGMCLSIANGAGAMLPALSQAYAWAHVEDRSGKSDAASAFQERPSAFIARLMCPVHLQDNTPYIAALVPAFEAGRQAGLGREVTSTGSTLAWDENTEALDLPAYYHWEFATGKEDFEALIRKLHGVPVDDSVGLHDLDIAKPRGGLDIDLIMGQRYKMESLMISYQGALTSPVARPNEWKEKHRELFQNTLRETLSPQVSKPRSRQSYRAVEHDPVISPPVYGSFQRSRDLFESGDSRWMNSANLDPQYRSNAGLGSRTVRKHQEELMGKAWARAKGIDQVNGYLRQARVALSVGTNIHTRLARLPAAQYVQITTAVQPRVTTTGKGKASVAQQLEKEASLPAGVLSATFRRTAVSTQTRVKTLANETSNASGTLQFKATLSSLSGQAALLTDRLPALNAGARPRHEYSFGGVTIRPDQSLERLSGLVGIKLPGSKTILGSPGMRRVGPASANNPDKKIISSIGKLKAKPIITKRASRSVAAINTKALKQTVQTATLPGNVLPTLVLDRVQGLAQPPAKQLEIPRSALLHVSFEEPAYEWLSKSNPEFLLPGFGTIAEDSVSLLVSNAAFVESYLLGLNHEMSREFAWRQFPAMLNSTWFRRFWDYLGSTPKYDIAPIANWQNSRRLGAGRSAKDSVVLVKSALFRRYPDTLVYAVPAIWQPIDQLDKDEASALRRSKQVTGNGMVRLADFSNFDAIVRPGFSGRIGGSAAFFGFPKDPATMVGTATPEKGKGDAGYFFVFEQAPTNQKFGLDRAEKFTPKRAPGSADDLTWGHFAASKEALDVLSHATASPAWSNRNIEGARWGRTAAETAMLALQRPVRIMFHASGLINLDAVK